MTIKEVKGESVMEWKIKVTTKEGIVIQFHGYELTLKEEVEENEGLKEVWEKIEYVISDSDSDLESTTKSENDFKALLVEEFCPSNEMEKLENEFWNHTVSAILTDGILTDEAVCCGTLTKGNDKRKKIEESSKQGSTWKDNKRSNTGSGFVATVPSRNDNVNTYLNCAKCYTFHPENAPFDFSFISIKFAPLLNVEPCIVNPGYAIEIADGKSVEVDRVIRDCKLELGNSLFTIDLIPLGHGSFDVIVGMD
ncbi:hypothetical protein Tco_0533154 [Tanacetum coccineum]